MISSSHKKFSLLLYIHKQTKVESLSQFTQLLGRNKHEHEKQQI
jgi:hypothetical protein